MARTKHTELDVDDLERRSGVFHCPHCKAALQFNVKAKVWGIYEIDDKEQPVPRTSTKKDKLTPEERAIVEEARSAGVLDAFIAAYKAATNNKPADFERSFITFLNRADKVSTPQFAIRLCLDEEDASGDLELWTFTYVSVALADGEFREFIPTSLIKGRPTAALQVENGSLKSTRRFETVDEWIKTRFGYVKGRGLLFSEMRKRAAGDFAKATGNY